MSATMEVAPLMMPATGKKPDRASATCAVLLRFRPSGCFHSTFFKRSSFPARIEIRCECVYVIFKCYPLYWLEPFLMFYNMSVRTLNVKILNVVTPSMFKAGGR